MYIPVEILPKKARRESFVQCENLTSYFSSRILNLYESIEFHPVMDKSEEAHSLYFIILDKMATTEIQQAWMDDPLFYQKIKDCWIDVDNFFEESSREFENVLSERIRRGPVLLYKIQFSFKKNSPGNLIVNPLHQSRVLFVILNKMIGNHSKVFQKNMIDFFFIIPQDFAIDNDLLCHQLQIALKEQVPYAMDFNQLDVQSIKVKTLDEKVINFFDGETVDLGNL